MKKNNLLTLRCTTDTSIAEMHHTGLLRHDQTLNTVTTDGKGLKLYIKETEQFA